MPDDRITQAKICFVKNDNLEEDTFLYEISATNGRFAAAAENYIDSTELINFGRALEHFPGTDYDQVTFQVGKDDLNSSGFIFLRAYLYDASGHAAVEVKLISGSAYAGFIIRTEIASLNRLGQSLVSWVHSKERKMEYELYTGLH